MTEKEQPKYYNKAVREAIYRHRHSNREKYNTYMRQYYQRKSGDPVWKENRLKKCREANKRYRDKQHEEQQLKPRGRPKKIDPLQKYHE